MSTPIEAENIERVQKMIDSVNEQITQVLDLTPDHMEDLRILAATGITLTAVTKASRKGVLYEMGLMEHIKNAHLTFNRETAMRERLELLESEGFDEDPDQINPISSPPPSTNRLPHEDI